MLKLERQVLARNSVDTVVDTATVAVIVMLLVAITMSGTFFVLEGFAKDHRPPIINGECPAGWRLERQPYSWICVR